MATPPANTRTTTIRAPEHPVGADGGDGAEARIRTSRGWRRLIRGTLVVLAQAAGTLLVLGVLSGTARANVAGSHAVEAPEQLVASRDVRVGPPEEIVEADATSDGARATVDISVAAFRASVAVDEISISFALDRTRDPEQVDETPAHDGPHGPLTTVAGGRRNARPSSDGDDRRTTSTRADWFSLSARAGHHEGAATSSRHPLGRQLHTVGATAGAAATSSADSRPDVLGFLAHRSLPHDSAPRSFRSVVKVFTSELVASTGPPG